MTNFTQNRAPWIKLRSVPTSEREDVNIINTALISIDLSTKNFSAALKLYAFCKANISPRHFTEIDKSENFRAWKMISARDGAMTLYHFGEAISAIQASSMKSPCLSPHIDKKKLKTANKMLREFFPDAIKIRNSVAHVEEKIKSAAKASVHSMSNNYENKLISIHNVKKLVITDSLLDDEFTSTWEGRLVKYSINQQSFENLEKIKNEFWDAFRAAEAYFDQLSPLAPDMASTPPKPDEQQP